ncbi:hypothetical protein BV22DRAFT_758509 [Leucogyrophana mollusca]|uniref:Uncharacterized protein n=1 Tax=Leucogyrophana mollusca TaxID=85980 RepID=A0ACB8B651_9AGAM|nr:hypothetical protein BV22DRAFT_758509 [Leucogyrophana mollusca]
MPRFLVLLAAALVCFHVADASHVLRATIPRTFGKDKSAARKSRIITPLLVRKGRYVARESPGCPAGTVTCHNFPQFCAEDGWFCCDDGEHTCKDDENCTSTECCPKSAQTCEGQLCCEPGAECCIGNEQCCDQNTFCCNDETGGCCPTGYQCISATAQCELRERPPPGGDLSTGGIWGAGGPSYPTSAPPIATTAPPSSASDPYETTSDPGFTTFKISSLLNTTTSSGPSEVYTFPFTASPTPASNVTPATHRDTGGLPRAFSPSLLCCRVAAVAMLIGFPAI